MSDVTEAEGERWGWELRTPESPMPTPFEEEPPGPAPVEARWVRRLSALREKLEITWYAHFRRFAGVVLFAGLTWLVFTIPLYGRMLALASGLITVLFAYFAIRPFVLPAWSDARYRRWRSDVLARQHEVAQASEQWTQRRDEHQRWLDAQNKPERWAPLKPATTHRVDIYGGDPPGSQALLLSVAGSILESGGAVTVVDLSQDGICHGLVQYAINSRRPFFAATLPSDLPVIGLFHGLSPEDIGETVAEAVHVQERERSAGGDRTLDSTLISQVAGCLHGPLTFRRLYVAVKVVAEQRSRPDEIGKDEFDRLESLLSEGSRRSVEGRLFRLSAAMQQLAALEPTTVRGTAGPLGENEQSQLVVWDLSERVGPSAGDLLAQASFQVLLHRLRHDRFEEGRVLIVLGADRFRRTHIERLDQLARRRSVRLALFYRHLREDAVELLGGGEAVMFMRLGNAKEAESAATFIGRDHRLVLSQFTVQHSSSLSTTLTTNTSESESDQQSLTKGRQWSRSRNYKYGSFINFPHDSGSTNRGHQTSTTHGTSASYSTSSGESQQTGTSESRSVGYQRAYEFVVEPRFLQSLGSTTFVLVDPRDPGSPRVGDASPEIDGEMPSLAKPDQVSPSATSSTLAAAQQTAAAQLAAARAAADQTAASPAQPAETREPMTQPSIAPPQGRRLPT